VQSPSHSCERLLVEKREPFGERYARLRRVGARSLSRSHGSEIHAACASVVILGQIACGDEPIRSKCLYDRISDCFTIETIASGVANCLQAARQCGALHLGTQLAAPDGWVTPMILAARRSGLSATKICVWLRPRPTLTLCPLLRQVYAASSSRFQGSEPKRRWASKSPATVRRILRRNPGHGPLNSPSIRTVRDRGAEERSHENRVRRSIGMFVDEPEATTAEIASTRVSDR